jgi:hypothetical protein
MARPSRRRMIPRSGTRNQQPWGRLRRHHSGQICWYRTALHDDSRPRLRASGLSNARCLGREAVLTRSRWNLRIGDDLQGNRPGSGSVNGPGWPNAISEWLTIRTQSASQMGAWPVLPRRDLYGKLISAGQFQTDAITPSPPAAVANRRRSVHSSSRGPKNNVGARLESRGRWRCPHRLNQRFTSSTQRLLSESMLCTQTLDSGRPCSTS